MTPSCISERRSPPKQEHAGTRLWLALSLGICVSIQVAGLRLVDPVIDGYDSKEYLSISHNLFTGKGFAVSGVSFRGFESFTGEVPTRMRQPGYPFYLVLAYWSLGGSLLALQVSQLVLNILTFYLTFLIAREIFGARLQPGTLVGLAMYFPLWITSAFVLTESLFTFVVSALMLHVLRGIHSKKVGHFTLSGALLGLAFLVRPIALLLCLLAAFPIWLRVKTTKTMLHWAALLGAFFVVVSPWFLRNALALGDYTPVSSDGGYNLWYASTPEDEPEWFGSAEFRAAVQQGYYIDRAANARFTRTALTHIKANPFDYLKRGFLRVAWVWSYFPGSQLYRKHTVVFGLFTLVQLTILLLAIVGLATVDKGHAAYLLLPAVTFSCVLMFTKAKARFILPAMPFVLLAAGQGASCLMERFPRLKAGAHTSMREDTGSTI